MSKQHNRKSTSRAQTVRHLLRVGAAALLALAASVPLLALAWPSRVQADPASPAAPPVYHVDKDATGAQTGETWADAFTSLQDALDVAVGAEIWVAEGVYYPDEGLTQVDGDRSSTFKLRQGVTIYGGFDGTENLVGERDWVQNITVLSGDLAKNDSVDANGVVTDPEDIVGTDNAYHVVTVEDVMLSAKLNGFVITAGLADSTVEAADLEGAGIYINEADPDLANLIVQGNKASGEILLTPVGLGGGIYISKGTPQFTNVTVRNNYARTSGGGLYVENSDGGLANLTLEDNVAGASGGGMYVTTTAGHSLSNLNLMDNHATDEGGGLYIQSGVLSTLSNSSLTTNSAERGGGLYIGSSVVNVTDVGFSSNSAVELGGGIFLQQGDYGLIDVTVQSNSAGTAGGGIYASQNIVSIDIALLTGNTSAEGAGMYIDDEDLDVASLTMNNAIFVNNHASQHGGGLYVKDATHGTLDGVSFLLNRASAGNGGGMLLLNSSGYTLAESEFDGNAAISGGGMFVEASSPSLTEVSFADNEAQVDYVDDSHGGGGIYLAGSSHATFSDCSFSGNEAASGGGMFISDSNPELINVSFTGNQAGDGISGSGGGLWNDEGTPTLVNVLFGGNACTLDGGGMRTGGAGSNPLLINTTFSGNIAGANGGGLNTTSPNLTIRNSVIWNNKDMSGTGTAGASITGVADVVTYSLIQGHALAAPNLDGTDPGNDPQFVVPVDPDTAPTKAGDLSVKFGSPIVDAGDNTAIPPGVTVDLAGNTRIYNAIVDLGAYELPLACPPPETTRLYVNQAASGGNTGVSGPDALRDLRDAFTLAANCGGIVEIWVAQGVYRPDEGVGMVPDDRAETYELIDGVAVYGGFVGPNFLPEERDWQSHVTVLSGDIDGNDISSGGIVLNPGNIRGANSYHVVIASGTGNTTILDGFTISAGQADDSTVDQADRGAGLYNDAGSPTLANLSFVGNTAGDGAGLANINGSNPSITSVQFQSNVAETYGGALYNMDSSPTLSDTVLIENTAYAGAAIYNLTSSPTLTNTVLSGNTASEGAALFNNASNPSLINALFSGNSADTGAAIYNSASNPTLVNITVSGNRASSTAGGMFNTSTSVPKVDNSIFWNNEDGTGAGTASATIYNNDLGSVPAINYSLVQGLSSIDHTGDHNLDSNPWFAAPEDPAVAPSTGGDYTLSLFSPALDVGDNAANSTLTDLAGDPRIINSVIDMGAYEAPYRIVYRFYLPAILRNYP